jgi:GT2 family glycosyltransferase
MTPGPPVFSVVTPTHRRPDSLLGVLDGLAAQDCPAGTFEVVLVFDGPDEATALRVRERAYPFELRVHQQERRGPAGARNAGLSLARGSHVLFLDDDVIPDHHLVAAHREAHGDASDLVVIGPLLAPPDRRAAPWTRWEWSTLAEQYRAMTAGEWQATPRQFYTGNASVRRAHIVAVDGFDEDFRRGEDVELAWRLHRLGLRFVFRPEAAGVHLARRSFRSWLGAASEYGRTDVMLERIRTGDDVPPWVLREFGWRHPLTRRLTLAALRRPWLVSALRLAGEPLLRAAALLGEARASQACSAAFTMIYWDGVAGLLGDRRRLLRLLVPAPPSEVARSRAR